MAGAALAPGEQPAVVEEHVDQLPEQVVQGLDQLLAHERVVGFGDELPLRVRLGEGDRQRPTGARRGQRRDRLGPIGLLGAKGDRDVVGLDDRVDLGGQRAALGGEAERRQGALADDHGVDELHGDVADIGARRGRVPQRDEAATADEPLGHPVTAAGDPLGLGREEGGVGLGPQPGSRSIRPVSP